MTKTLPAKRILSLICFLFFATTSFAQLANFTLTVTPAPQTCLGNGSLTFAVSGTTAGSSIDYNVYLLPNTTTPVTTVTTPSATGLVAGTYQVVATQSLGGQSNTATATAVIANNVIPLTYTLAPTQVRCGTDGKITVNVTGGTAATYEITSGPVTAPVQTSNVFNNLPPGLYNVRVYDTCGEAVVTSITLVQLNTTITIDPVSFPGGELPSCTTINIEHHYYCPANLDIFFPLTFTYTVTPPGGGAPTIITETVAGGADDNVIGTTIPFYHDQQYNYNLVITDACGNTYVRNNNIVNQELSLSVNPSYPNCTDIYFTLAPNNYVGPYTLNFTAMPAGFTPLAFNSDYPTFDSGEATFGGPGNAVPTGNYTVSISDSCGHTAQLSFEITPPDVNPLIIPLAVCGSPTGSVSITIPGRLIESVVITAAPTAYAGTLPDDVSENINQFGGFEMLNLPIGTYTFVITDSCGDEYTEVVVLQPSGGSPTFAVLNRPGCDVGFGSIRLAADGGFEVVTILAAPTAFTETLPFDASANIAANGFFYMNNLPAGVYTFYTEDACGVERQQQVTVTGYTILVNEFEVIPHCGSFDLEVAHTSNGNYVQSFWLQRFNPITSTWGHPLTGVAYPANTLPNTANAIQLANNTTYLTLAATGQFRVLKNFYTYSNGTLSNFRCTTELYNFTFDDAPVINAAYGFPCIDGLTEVVIDATGVPPLTYSITTKDGDPFVVNNGQSSLFSGLETATYNFQVTDVCGNIRNILFDINNLDPVAIEADGFCEGELSTLSIPEFSFLSYEWYSDEDPDTILSTTGTLTFPAYTSVTDAGIYHLAITSINPNSCLNQVLDYEVLPNQLPAAGPDNTAILCNDGATIDLTTYLTAPFDAGGAWEDVNTTGALVGSQFTTAGLAPGTYQFKYTVSGLCNSTDEATVSITLKNIPAAPIVATVADSCEGSNVQLGATAVAGNVVTYQWTGPNGFTSADQSPLITAATTAASGTYSLIVTVDGCPSPASQVAVLVKPTPQFTLQGNTVICAGQSTVLSVVPGANFTPNPQTTYAWYYQGNLQTEATDGDVEVTEAGQYTVIVNNNGCSFTQQIAVSLNTNAFDIEVEGGCVDYAYIVSVINQDEIGDNAVYSWTGPDNFTFNGPEADITDRKEGDYIVTVTNADGCTATATLPVDNTSCIIPKGVSPNGDGLNDSFDLSNLDVRHLQIFNRYGLQVYERAMYLKEWFGQSDKGDLTTGTYYYVITLSAGTQVTGWVYLQREVN